MIFYNSKGEESEEDKAILKVGDTTASLKVFRGQAFDPMGMYKHKLKDTTWRLVNSECARLYLKYLQTKRTDLLTLAEREMINV